MGWIASSWGVPLSMAIGGLGSLLTGVAMLAWMRRIRGADLFAATVATPRRAEARAGVGATAAAPARPR